MKRYKPFMYKKVFGGLGRMKYIGIDVAKHSHTVCVLNNKKEKVHTFNIKNSEEGWGKFQKTIENYDKTFKIGLESSGIYHHGILFHLKQKYNDVAVINPKRIKAHRKSLGYEYKADPIDAYIISDYVKERDLSNNILPEKYPLLKQLCRTRTKLVRQQTRLKNRIKGDMHVLFPEYAKCFDSIYCNSSLHFLKKYTDPKQVTNLKEEEIVKILLEKSSHHARIHAKRIKQAAQISFGIPKQGLDTEIKLAIENLTIIQKQIKIIDNKIEYRFKNIFNPLSDVKGLTFVYAAGIIAESGDISYFKSRGQYYNFTGLVPRHASSGQFVSKFNHINKCGSSYLRHYLIQAVMKLVQYNSYFKKIYIKKHHIEKKSKQEAHVYCAKKLCYIIFKLLKSNTMFCPDKLKAH